MTDEFGTCKHCNRVATVKINGTPACLEHMDREFHNIGVVVREIVKRVVK